MSSDSATIAAREPAPLGSGSTLQRSAPRMSHHTLTVLLGLMTLVPAITIAILWRILPPVAEGRLEASAWGVQLPDPAIYARPLRDRPPVTGGKLVIRNDSGEPWTHINIWVNGFYQLYDLDALQPGEERAYPLDRFVTRFGASCDLRYNPLKSTLLYARMPRGNRATKFMEFSPAGEPRPAVDGHSTTEKGPATADPGQSGDRGEENPAGN